MRNSWQTIARGFALASGALIATSAFTLAAPAGTPAPAPAPAPSGPCAGPQFTCVPVDWDPTITSQMSLWIANPPTTTSTLGTGTRKVDFAMKDAYIELRPNTSSTKSGLSTTKATAMHLILNTSSTPAGAAGATNGTVTVTYTDGTTTTFSLVVASNDRDWEIGLAPAPVAVINSASTANAWTGQATDTHAAALDMVMVPLKGTVQPVSVTVANTSGFGLSWFGLTIENTVPVVVPPVVVPPTTTGGGQTGNHDGENSDKQVKNDEKEDSAADKAADAKEAADAKKAEDAKKAADKKKADEARAIANKSKDRNGDSNDERGGHGGRD
jgi:hypothetical protein